MFRSLAQFGFPGNLHLMMGVAMFQGAAGQQFFQNIWSMSQSSVTSLVGSGGAITLAAYSILSVVLIAGVYEAFAKGGGMRDLIVLMAKVAVCGLLISKWSTFFTDITTNGSFALANSISSNDFYTTLQAAIKSMATIQYGSFSLTDLGQDGVCLINLVAIGIAMVLYWVVYYLMIFAFTVWGLILMAIGPLLVATIPSSLVSSFGSTYMKALLQWLSWPILYSVMGALVQGLQSNATWSDNPGAFSNMDNLTIAGVTITFSIALISIPWMANSIIAGDFARSLGGVLSQIDPTGASKHGSQNAHSSSGGGGGGGNEGGGGSSGASDGPPSATPGSGSAGSSSASAPGVSAPGASPGTGGSGMLNGAPMAGEALGGAAAVAEVAPAAAVALV